MIVEPSKIEANATGPFTLSHSQMIESIVVEASRPAPPMQAGGLSRLGYVHVQMLTKSATRSQ